jgi:large subunit ribosomal protein L23
MTRDAASILLKPVVSEKSYALMEKNAYVFVVAQDANAIEIRRAVEQVFGVRVKKVNTLNRKGKTRRNRRTNTLGKLSGSKRAFVTLAAGERIDLFEKS